MRRFITALLASAVAGALFVASPLIAAPKGTEDYNKSADTPAADCGTGNALTVHAPAKLWPPNHKYFEDVFALATDAEGESITLETRGVHDQYAEDTGLEQNGSGNTADDIAVDDNDAEWVQEKDANSNDPQVIAVESAPGEVQTDWAVRAERSGRDQTGRTYTLEALATFSDGSCSVSVDMIVPHDMRPSNR